MSYELIDHTGDLGILVRASTFERLLEEAAHAMFDQIADRSAAATTLEDRFEREAAPPEEALRWWLAELLYNFSAEGRIYADFAVRLAAGRMYGSARGEPYDSDRHPLRTELKAVTYHQLQVVQEKDGWKARVIFDV